MSVSAVLVKIKGKISDDAAILMRNNSRINGILFLIKYNITKARVEMITMNPYANKFITTESCSAFSLSSLYCACSGKSVTHQKKFQPNIFDALTRKVKSSTLHSNQNTFELSVAELPAGVFWLLWRVKGGGGERRW